MEVRDRLRSTIFGAVLDGPALDRLAGDVTVREFPRGTALVRERDIGSSMFVLTEGRVAVDIHAPGGSKRVAELGPGEIVGEMSLFTGERRSATVTALRRVVAIEIEKERLAPLIAGERDLIRRFAETIDQRRAELRGLSGAGRSGISRDEIMARMTAWYAG